MQYLGHTYIKKVFVICEILIELELIWQSYPGGTPRICCLYKLPFFALSPGTWSSCGPCNPGPMVTVEVTSNVKVPFISSHTVFGNFCSNLALALRLGRQRKEMEFLSSVCTANYCQRQNYDLRFWIWRLTGLYCLSVEDLSPLMQPFISYEC